jgi:dynein heavy chain 2
VQRWKTLRPKHTQELDREGAREAAQMMRDWREQWTQIEKQTEVIVQDYQQLDMDAPIFSHLVETRTELREEDKTWASFDDFSARLAEFETQNWLVFRTKLYTFQDFTMEWTEKLQSADRDVITNYMRK